MHIASYLSCLESEKGNILLAESPLLCSLSAHPSHFGSFLSCLFIHEAILMHARMHFLRVFSLCILSVRECVRVYLYAVHLDSVVYPIVFCTANVHRDLLATYTNTWERPYRRSRIWSM